MAPDEIGLEPNALELTLSLGQGLGQFRRNVSVSAPTLVHLVIQMEIWVHILILEKLLFRCDGPTCGSHLILEKWLFVQHSSESVSFG